MAGGVADYAAISARGRAMYADLLTPQDFVRLSEAPDFVSLFNILKTTAYGPYLEGLKDKDINPRRVIIQIKRKLADAYNSVIQMAPVETRPPGEDVYFLFLHGEFKTNLSTILSR